MHYLRSLWQGAELYITENIWCRTVYNREYLVPFGHPNPTGFRYSQNAKYNVLEDNVKNIDLITVLKKVSPEADIQISVDISTGEHDSHLRVFVAEFLEFLEPGNLLFSGEVNSPKVNSPKEVPPADMCKIGATIRPDMDGIKDMFRVFERPSAAASQAMYDYILELENVLSMRNKQIGISCEKHDLVHTLSCGHCFKEQQEELSSLIEKTKEQEDVCYK